MATLTISLSGSAVVNGTKTYTVSDADIQQVLDWAQDRFNVTGTNQQILLAWVQDWINNTRQRVQQFKTTQTVTVPPPITMT